MCKFVRGLLLVPALWGQPVFHSLAPNGDGSALYFSSFPRLKGTNQYPNQFKIFVWDRKNGVRLYQQKPPTITILADYSQYRVWSSTTAYNLVAASVSSDGRTVATTGLSDCNHGTPCATREPRYQAEIRVEGREEALVFPGTPSVSPNGRFVALGSPIQYPMGTPELTVLDLVTGQTQRVVGILEFSRRHGVSDNGSVVVQGADWSRPLALRGWSGATRTLSVSSLSPVQIDAAGARLFYLDTVQASRLRLVSLDLKTGASLELMPLSPQPTVTPLFDISDDGSLVAFLHGGRAWIIRLDGSTLRQVTSVPFPVEEVALSGSGSHLFAVTPTSSILRIDLRTMEAEEIVPATPFGRGIANTSGVLSPGASAKWSPEAGPLPEIRSVDLFGRDLRIVSTTPNSVVVQLPYDMPEGAGWPGAVLQAQGSGPFESALRWSGPVQVSNYAPQWYLRNNRIAALHEDYSGAVTDARPARTGQIVHVFGRGFGPVTPQPPLGQVAAASPLSRVTTPFVCGLSNSAQIVRGEILFAGLAPGWIGLYQFDIRLPEPPPGVVSLVCGRERGPEYQYGSYASGLLPVSGK